jgi:hypothetical protein
MNGSINTICAAIQAHLIIRFYYTGDDIPGYRTVEPHMLAYNAKNNLALSGWFLGGDSESQEGQGWREFLLSATSNIEVTQQQFARPRPGYNPSGGKIFHNVLCAL